jgi:hypothetical protein
MSVKLGGRWWIAWLEANGWRERVARHKIAGGGSAYSVDPPRTILTMVATDSGVLQAIGQQTFEEDGDDDRDPPDGIEEEIDTLMASLSDKVCRSSSTHAYDFIDRFRAIRIPSYGTLLPNTSPGYLSYCRDLCRPRSCMPPSDYSLMAKLMRATWCPAKPAANGMAVAWLWQRWLGGG